MVSAGSGAATGSLLAGTATLGTGCMLNGAVVLVGGAIGRTVEKGASAALTMAAGAALGAAAGPGTPKTGGVDAALPKANAVAGGAP